jgi:D-alanine-D-alanine ligase
MTADPRPLVAVLFGGMSGEHQISCATAGGVLGAIDEEKWQAFAIGITPDGQWVPMPSDPLAYVLGDDGGYTVEAGDLRVAILPGSPRLIQFEVDDGGHPVPETVRTIGDIDVLFPLLHGPYGEDGTVQGLLELSKVRYVGCGGRVLGGMSGQVPDEDRPRRRGHRRGGVGRLHTARLAR